MDKQHLWQLVMDELEPSLAGGNYKMWLNDSFIVDDANDIITIGVSNSFFLDWIQKKFHKSIAGTIRRLRPTTKEIVYKIASKKAVESEPAELELKSPPRPETDQAAEYASTSNRKKTNLKPPSYDPPVSDPTSPDAQPATTNTAQTSSPGFQPTIANFDPVATTPTGHTPLDPSRTFETFIVGNSNRLAHAVSLATANEPGHKYNPLFLYGGVGLGKTHLAQAIGNEIRRQNPTTKITYVSCEGFMNQFIESVRKKTVDDFKKRFRHTDVLLIDDVQFLSGKEGTQEEFFHTFNALHQAKKQIVLTADCEPKNIPEMEDRLTSRFIWGMVADIQPPDFETRVAIVRAKCIEKKLPLDDAAILLFAKLIQSNIRELEGNLEQVVSKAELEKRPVDADFIALTFGGGTSMGRNHGLSANRIIQIVSEFFELRAEEVIGPRRYKELVYPRQLIMYLIRHELSYSYPNIGKAIGGKDHTTVMHGVEKISKEMARNNNIQYDLTKLKERLYQSS